MFICMTPCWNLYRLRGTPEDIFLSPDVEDFLLGTIPRLILSLFLAATWPQEQEGDRDILTKNQTSYLIPPKSVLVESWETLDHYW